MLKPRYRENMKLYLGKHKILTAPEKETGADNRIVVNSAKYVVDVYNGYFCGIEPKLALLNGSNKIDEIARWNRQENF
ncbi:phage portal protein [Klebsiella quasipneumoniae]|uniref:phage portal protein n=1 Tax=Klebsiella quasipneumoniae TaxID=1463165 RepID=UPI00296FC6DB|nr:phage portal protein [Klebsiella quasipneumoniae]